MLLCRIFIVMRNGASRVEESNHPATYLPVPIFEVRRRILREYGRWHEYPEKLERPITLGRRYVDNLHIAVDNARLGGTVADRTLRWRVPHAGFAYRC